MKTVPKKNGTIELMRFIFCVMVILYHFNNRLMFENGEFFSFFRNGKIGVEFFFLVSGWLMAKSAQKYKGKPILKSTGNFIYKKFMSILPYHLFIYVICLVIMIFFLIRNKTGDVFYQVINTLPNLFFLQKSGIMTNEILTAEWYIAAMLWMMLIIFPLILRFGEGFEKIACLLICILLIGYMSHANNKLGGMNRFVIYDSIPKAYVRAFAEMCGGVFCFHISTGLKNFKLTKADRIFLSVVEIVCYVLPILYCISVLGQKYEALAFYFLMAAITVSFSETSYLSTFMNNKINYFLGTASLPLYMAQAVGFAVFLYCSEFKVVSKSITALFFTATTVIFAVLSYFFSKKFSLNIRKNLRFYK